MLSCVLILATPWTAVHQPPPSMEFSRQEYWNGLLFPIPGDHPIPGIQPASLVSHALADGFLYLCTTWEGPILLQ